MEALPGEASCPICREFFRDPVSIPCGHHFCRACIESCWASARGRFPCPRCRAPAPERSLRPSPELARLLELALRLSRGEALPEEEEEEEDEDEEGCLRHREPLEAFCREDGALLCAICRESRAHRGHCALPLPEAVRELREQIQARLQTLQEDRDKLVELREAEMRRSCECLEMAEAERRRILGHFQALRAALAELRGRLLARLGRIRAELGRAREESAARLGRDIAGLEARARELRERSGEPARTLLKDIGGTLSSLGQAELALPPSALPALEMEMERFREESAALEEALRGFQDFLAFELPEKMTVTLDPSTAHPQLRVAPDGSGVSWDSGPEPPGHGTEPEPGPGAGSDPSVLAREAVRAGRRCWDVQVSPEGSWALGVVTETPGSGGETPGNGGETPGNGGETLGIGGETPGNGGETPGSGRENPGNWGETLGIGGETPRNGGENPGNGTGTLGNWGETLEIGGETPRNGTGSPGNWGENPWNWGETLGIGGETPRNGTENPGNGTGTLGNWGETLEIGGETPRNGTGSPGNWGETLGNWGETLGNGGETPRNGGENPGIGAGTPRIGTGTPGIGTGTPGIGAGTPGIGTGTPGSPERQLWAVGRCQGRFWALTALERVPLFPGRGPGRLRVALDLERGRLAFFDAERRSLLCAFPAASFGGRAVRPCFVLWGEGSWISLCP